MKLRSVIKNKKGQAGGSVGAIVSAFIVGAVIILFLWINSVFKTSIDRMSWTTDENTTYERLNTNVNSAFNLGSILPLVMVVVAVIGAILIIGKAF